MNIEGKSVQAVLAAALAWLSTALGVLIVPIMMLTAAMIIDYCTGMASAWRKANLSSKKGIAGIIKKLGYLVLVCVGLLVDWLIFCGLETFNAGGMYQFSFGALVAVWLIINELISILENLGTIGVPVPKFLINVIKRLKISTENVGESEDNKDER